MLEGVFHDAGDGLAVYPDEGDPRLLSEALVPFLGCEVNLSLHHYPPTPPRPSPGGGSCMWAGHCPCGHEVDPAWLYNLNLKGDLNSPSSGKWAVSEEPVPLMQYMLGHRGRLVVFKEGAVDSDKSAEELVAEAESLLGILEGLRGVIKK